jgi:hypothetical protein
MEETSILLGKPAVDLQKVPEEVVLATTAALELAMGPLATKVVAICLHSAGASLLMEEVLLQPVAEPP